MDPVRPLFLTKVKMLIFSQYVVVGQINNAKRLTFLILSSGTLEWSQKVNLLELYDQSDRWSNL